MIEDAELLRRYVEDRSEEAFAELVRRRVNLVYSVALRQVGGDAHLAEDVTQRVFTDLARKARALVGHAVLSGWLFRSAQYAASDAVRAERRRRAREQEAQIMNEMLMPDDPAGWEKSRPLLDQVLGELDAEDRDALALRFFEERSFAEVGAAVRLTEDAARKRVNRALDKLHGLLARRGVNSTTAALGVALAGQAGVAAPLGFAATVTSGALAGAVVTGASTVAGAGTFATLLTFMSTGKTIIGLAGIAAAVVVGTAYVASERADEAAAALNTVSGVQVSVDARMAALEKQVEVQTQRVSGAEAENVRLRKAVAEKPALAGSAAEKEVPLTSDVASARLNEVLKLIRSGDYPAAFKEILWLYDVGLTQTANLTSVRSSSGVSVFGELADKYPPARVALEERRETSRQKMMADADNYDAISEYGAITRALKDGAAAIALLEQFPPGDKRRAGMARAAFEDLIEGRRYALALEGRNAAMVLAVFETITRTRLPAKLQTEEVLRVQREVTVKRAVVDVEMLAGAGDLANARLLATRLLAYDGSESTQASLQQHLARAGHPELLSSAAR
jgi:RNA polymerase sigma factor (sigma-70 family)